MCEICTPTVATIVPQMQNPFVLMDVTTPPTGRLVQCGMWVFWMAQMIDLPQRITMKIVLYQQFFPLWHKISHHLHLHPRPTPISTIYQSQRRIHCPPLLERWRVCILLLWYWDWMGILRHHQTFWWHFSYWEYCYQDSHCYQRCHLQWVHKSPYCALWDQHTTAIHGLTAASPKIQNANGINMVWQNFYKFINKQVPPSKVFILVAYNGGLCNLKWVWKLTQTPNSSLPFPDQNKFFMDPLKIISNDNSCPLHPSKSELESFQLNIIYHFVTGTQLEESHDSKNDITAQTLIVSSNSFHPFINHAVSMSHIQDIFLKSECSAMLNEPHHQIYEPWIEQTKIISIA